MNIQDIQLSQVKQIYSGQDNACRCGCKGTYVACDDLDNRLLKTRLKRAKKLALQSDTEVEYDTNYINVSFGNNRAITIYLD